MFDQDIKNSVTHMDIINTSLTQFPNLTLSDWPNLFSLDIRDNDNIDCEEIRRFQYSYPQLLVLTDCDDFTPNILKDNNKKKQTGMQLLFVLLALPVLPILTAIYRQQRNRLRGAYIKGEAVTQPSLSRTIEV